MPLAQRARVFAGTGAPLAAGDLVVVGLAGLTLLPDQGAGDGRRHLPPRTGSRFQSRAEDSRPSEGESIRTEPRWRRAAEASAEHPRESPEESRPAEAVKSCHVPEPQLSGIQPSSQNGSALTCREDDGPPS